MNENIFARPEILLHPNIPKPLHGLAPRTIMGDAWWNRERQKAYAGTNYHCEACWIEKEKAMFHQWLEAHELYEFDYPKGRMTFIELVPLCHACHNYIHSGRMQALVDKGEMELKKLMKIVTHGDLIIKAAKLKPKKEPKKIAAWEDWRLVFNGKEYGPVFNTFEDWLAKFHPGQNHQRHARKYGAGLGSLIMPNEDSQAAFELQDVWDEF